MGGDTCGKSLRLNKTGSSKSLKDGGDEWDHNIHVNKNQMAGQTIIIIIPYGNMSSLWLSAMKLKIQYVTFLHLNFQKMTRPMI